MGGRDKNFFPSRQFIENKLKQAVHQLNERKGFGVIFNQLFKLSKSPDCKDNKSSQTLNKLGLLSSISKGTRQNRLS